MKKSWLIRTKSNHILGPVSLEKIKQLLENGSLDSDDEICSGNGYWFYIREQELLDRYVYGDEKQSFNPVSEAESIISKSRQSYPKTPSGTDSDYPNESNTKDTKISINLDQLEKKKN